jgi:hypothetical protein
MYVIKRTDQGGGYLAKDGTAGAYTADFAKAKVFSTRVSAEADRCIENEIVVSVESVFNSN